MELLKDAERRTISVQWPQEVDDYLETLVKILKVNGTPVSRSQLLAALVAAAPLDGGALSEIARSYFRRPSGDLSLAVVLEDLPTLRHPGPLRRARKGP